MTPLQPLQPHEFWQELHPPAPLFLDRARLEGAAHEDILTGQSDHWGLRLSLRDGQLLVFPRLCPHEGACLDRQEMTGNSVRCPWHGRVLRPIATLAWPWKNPSDRIELRYHTLTPTPEGLQIDFKDTPLAAHVDPHEQVAAIDL